MSRSKIDFPTLLNLQEYSVGYANRYCAFIDILGFRDLLARLNDGVLRFTKIRDLLRRVHSPPPLQPWHMKHPPLTLVWGDKYLSCADLRAQSISDAVVLSTAINAGGLVLLCRAVSSVVVELLAQGFFVRGAIVKDRLYHDENTVFGEALVRAHFLESQVARYPRVMVTREVVSDMKTYDSEVMQFEQSKYLFRQAVDGPMFLHVLQGIQEFVAACMRNEGLDDPSSVPVVEHYASLGKQIQKRFDEALDTPKHFEKVQWFAQYWNREIADLADTGFPRLTGAGLDRKQE